MRMASCEWERFIDCNEVDARDGDETVVKAWWRMTSYTLNCKMKLLNYSAL